MGNKSGSGSGINNLDHISESLEQFFGLKYLNSLMRIRDPGWKKLTSGINIPDPHHWYLGYLGRRVSPEEGEGGEGGVYPPGHGHVCQQHEFLYQPVRVPSLLQPAIQIS
jgi:hypothetical protein